MTGTIDRRRILRDIARTMAVISLIMVALSAFTLVRGGAESAGAASAGAVTIAPASGSDTTEFNFSMPDGAACTGDNITGGYIIQTYMVPSSVDVNGLTFDASGPVAATGEYRSPLFNSGTTDTININPSPASTSGGPGLVTGLPGVTFSPIASEIPAGSYNVGVVCTKAGVLDKSWNTVVDVTASPFAWAVDDTPPSTTTTTVAGSTTTTEGDGSTTTTDGDGSTTTTTGDGTTSTTGDAQVSGNSISNSGGGGPSAASPVSTVGQLPFTGSTPIPMVLWAVSLLVFGRMAMLLGKRPKVVDEGSQQ